LDNLPFESQYIYLDDLRIKSYDPLIPPHCLSSEFALSDVSKHVIAEAREEIKSILDGKSKKIIVIVGPCSIHDVGAAMEYASMLKVLKDELKDELLIIMRTYFEKPRTRVGWKGLINDPFLDGSFKINDGLRIARKLLCDITEMGVPVACELLDTISPQFYADLISWGAVGARTTECQLHRELVSGVR
jgi:3-deoxy-7-phosphoheptulonate synthase